MSNLRWLSVVADTGTWLKTDQWVNIFKNGPSINFITHPLKNLK